MNEVRMLLPATKLKPAEPVTGGDK
jgi:hypothetical protein